MLGGEYITRRRFFLIIMTPPPSTDLADTLNLDRYFPDLDRTTPHHFLLRTTEYGRFKTYDKQSILINFDSKTQQ